MCQCYYRILICCEFLLNANIAKINCNYETGGPRTFSFGFGYGCTWGSIILIFSSVVLLICDRESEEIFYKERQVEEEEEEETGEA